MELVSDCYKFFISDSISFHDTITLISVATSGHYLTHHTYVEVRWSCEHGILIVTTPSRRPYHVVSTEGKRSLPLMYRPIRNSTWVTASRRLHQWILREKWVYWMYYQFDILSYTDIMMIVVLRPVWWRCAAGQFLVRFDGAVAREGKWRKGQNPGLRRVSNYVILANVHVE